MMITIHKIPAISCLPEYSIKRLPSSVLNILNTDTLDDEDSIYSFVLEDCENMSSDDATYYDMTTETPSVVTAACTAPASIEPASGSWCSWLEWAESCANDRNWVVLPDCSFEGTVLEAGPVKPIDTNDIFVPVPTPVAQIPIAAIDKLVVTARAGIMKIEGIAPIKVTVANRRATISYEKDDKEKEQENVDLKNPLHKSSDGSISISDQVNTMDVGKATHVAETDKNGKVKYRLARKGETAKYQKITKDDGTVSYKEVAASGSYIKDKDTGAIRKLTSKEIDDKISGTMRATGMTVDFVCNKTVTVDKKSPLTLNGQPAYQVGKDDPRSAGPHEYCIGLDMSSFALYAGDGKTIEVKDKDGELVDEKEAAYIISAKDSGISSMYGEWPIEVFDAAGNRQDKGAYKIKFDSTYAGGVVITGVDPIIATAPRGGQSTAGNRLRSDVWELSIDTSKIGGIKGVASYLKNYLDVNNLGQLYGTQLFYNSLGGATAVVINGRGAITVTQPTGTSSSYLIEAADGLSFTGNAKTYFKATTTNGIHELSVTDAFTRAFKLYTAKEPLFIDPKTNEITLDVNKLPSGSGCTIGGSATITVIPNQVLPNDYTIEARVDKITENCVKVIKPGSGITVSGSASNGYTIQLDSTVLAALKETYVKRIIVDGKTYVPDTKGDVTLSIATTAGVTKIKAGNGIQITGGKKESGGYRTGDLTISSTATETSITKASIEAALKAGKVKAGVLYFDGKSIITYPTTNNCS